MHNIQNWKKNSESELFFVRQAKVVCERATIITWHVYHLKMEKNKRTKRQDIDAASYFNEDLNGIHVLATFSNIIEMF